MRVIVCVYGVYMYIAERLRNTVKILCKLRAQSLLTNIYFIFSLCLFLSHFSFISCIVNNRSLVQPISSLRTSTTYKGCFPGYRHKMMGRCVVLEHHDTFVLQLMHQFILSCCSWRSFTFFSLFAVRNRRWARQMLAGFQETGISGSANVLYGRLRWFLNKEIGINSSYNVFYMLVGFTPSIFKIHFHYPLKIKRWSGSDTLDI